MKQMQKLWKLSSLLVACSLILSGCEVVNVNKYTEMYIDSFTYRENNQHAKYTEITDATFNENLNEKIFQALLLRATTYNVVLDEESKKMIYDSIDNFRENEVRIVLIDANEKGKSAKIKIYISDAYDILIDELRNNVSADVSAPEYNTQVITSLNNSIKNAKNNDTIEINVNILKSDTTEKYYMSKKSEDEIINFILGLK